MRGLQDVAHTLQTGRLHPTQVLNTLIDTENQGGLCAVRQLERQLARAAEALEARD